MKKACWGCGAAEGCLGIGPAGCQLELLVELVRPAEAGPPAGPGRALGSVVLQGSATVMPLWGRPAGRAQPALPVASAW